jgi:hypothetical protein
MNITTIAIPAAKNGKLIINTDKVHTVTIEEVR